MVKRNGKIIKPGIVKGYYHIILQKDGVSRAFQVHRIIASLFVPNPENKPYVDHINTIRTDCNCSNLSWSTRIENANNQLTKEKKYIKVVQYTIDNQYVNEYESVKIAGESTNIFATSISACCRGRVKTAGGFIWKYAS